jgi:tetratricopeptide (TPR) repeat protein
MARGKSFLVVIVLLVAVVAAGCSTASGFTRSSVTIYEKELVIPTYKIGKPDPNPRFYEGRAYQGAQGRVYPYPMMDRLTDKCEDKAYNAVYLENEYIRICVLPEIGGRVFEAVDKTNGFDFLYRQHVIKPALIGMIGAWISGGIEWNFPHHHRASVFLPMDYMLKDNPDGSKTLWMSEIEIRHRMRLVIGITLRPGKSYFEAEIKPYNRSPFVHSFLYWANVSVYADENYQVIFPPNTQFAVYHGKNAFVRWPVSHEMYRGVDYTKGVDMSWWKNHPSPMSFFAWNYKDDFLVGYDHKKGAGTAYIANPHLTPGKKFWQWGPGPQGRIWDKILTDKDGPYVELMVGAYSDNQPDYSWLQPYEGKSVRQHWYPIRDLGGVKNATLAAAVNMELKDKNAVKIGFNTTSEYKKAKALLEAGGKVVFEENIDISPGKPFVKEISLPAGIKETDLRVSLVSASGDELVAYQPDKNVETPMPEVVKRPPGPKEIKTVEELYLTGMRLEQFYNPSLSPLPYYEEALKRDPGDSRVNVAVGILYLKWCMFDKAEEHLRVALKRVTKDYTSPRNGEAYYYLGWVLKFQGKLDAAYDSLYKATWSYAFHTAAYFHLAEIDCMRGEFETALRHLDRSIVTNAWHTKALNLKAAVLRRLGRPKDAAVLAKKVSTNDPLNLWSLHEAYLAGTAMGLEKERIAELKAYLEPKWNVQVQDWYEAQAYLEIAVDYANAGLWDEAIEMLNLIAFFGEKRATTYPMVFYYLGYFWEKKGDIKKASEYYRIGGLMPADYCFPFRAESIPVLHAACAENQKDGRAHYYLGNLFYDRQPERAIKEWEKARDLDSGIATLHRNLARGYFQVEHNVAKAIASMEKAVKYDKDPSLFYELDVLYEAGGVSMQKRLDILTENHKYICDHNDAFSREIVLLTRLGHYDKAIKMMMPPSHFRRWEGLGNIHTTYLNAHLLRARKHLKAGRYSEAVNDYEAALEYPENLEVARPHHGGRDCEIYYLLGNVYDEWSNAAKAKEFYEKATIAKRHESRSALDFYQGMAYMKLGRDDKAGEMFDTLIIHGKKQLNSLKTGVTLEFFAKFGKKKSIKAQRADALYLMGLGFIGKGDVEAAKKKLGEALKLNANHLWAKIHLEDFE